MGILDELTVRLGQALGGGVAGSNNLVHGVLDLLNDPAHGGMTGLVQKFRDGGLGDIVNSWIGTGPNKTIAPDQLVGVLGADKVQQLSQATGMTREAMGAELASLVPSLIDKLTPQGTLPQGGLLAGAIGLLKTKLAQA